MKMTSIIARQICSDRTMHNAARFYYVMRLRDGGRLSAKVNLDRDKSHLSGFSPYQIKSYFGILVERGWCRTDGKGNYFFSSIATISASYGCPNSCQAVDVPESIVESSTQFRNFASAVVVGALAKSMYHLNNSKNATNEHTSERGRLAGNELSQELSLELIQNYLFSVSWGTAQNVRRWAVQSGLIVKTDKYKRIKDNRKVPIRMTWEEVLAYKESLDPDDAAKVTIRNGYCCIQCASWVTLDSSLLKRAKFNHGARIGVHVK